MPDCRSRRVLITVLTWKVSEQVLSPGFEVDFKFYVPESTSESINNNFSEIVCLKLS